MMNEYSFGNVSIYKKNLLNAKFFNQHRSMVWLNFTSVFSHC